VLAELPSGEGRLAGYFGVINERFRMDLVQGLLNAGWRVVLIGPKNHSAPPMPEASAFRWLGARPYGQLPRYLHHFDLALIPYDTQGAHRFLYPVKALEYLAGGKPVLSTPLPDMVRFLGDYVLLGETPAQWVAQAERLREDPETVRTATLKGREYAFSRSWDQMVDEMLATLEEKTG
jgi:glycosyltransferase involved in cell wall biosynthesis